MKLTHTFKGAPCRVISVGAFTAVIHLEDTNDRLRVDLCDIKEIPATPAPDLATALRACAEYLECIPETAAGGDDAAAKLAQFARSALAAN